MATRQATKPIYETVCDWCERETARKAGVPPKDWARIKITRNVDGKETVEVHDLGPECLAALDAAKVEQGTPEAA